MDKSHRLLGCILFVVLIASLSVNLTKPAAAIVPEIHGVIVWQNGSNIIVNVTVYHIPVQPTHRVNRIEVNVSGTNHIFDLVQTAETFTYPCNIGPVIGTPSAQVRARCSFDGYNAWSEPIIIPEYSLHALLITLIPSTMLATFTFRKIKTKRF